MSPEPQSRVVAMTVKEAAKYFNRSETGIRSMCSRGTFIAANCKVIKQKPGNWLIFVPLQ